MVNTTLANRSEVRTRTTHQKSLFSFSSFLMVLMFLLFNAGCTKDDALAPSTDPSVDTRSSLEKIRLGYEVTNLVADVEGYDAAIIDPNLVNAWGIAISPNGAFWISAAETELSTIYSDEGVTLRPPVTMEGEPTGQVFNGAPGFVIPTVGSARFIFATEYGTITAWRTGNVATTMIDRSAMGAGYTGLELASDGGQNFLYAANVAQGSIDVFDTAWNYVATKPFIDPNLPAGSSPFNIRLISGLLYVTYVGPGGGLVNIFTTGGTFVKRFATGGLLSAPWGITNIPPDFGQGQGILVGNFGDGRINIYNKLGHFKGQLGDEDGNPITIDGLWALTFEAGAFDGSEEPDLYFTAGPENETHGIFGEIEFVREEEE